MSNFSLMFALPQWTPSWNSPSSKIQPANNYSIRWSRQLDYVKYGFLDYNTQIQKAIWHGLNYIKRWVFEILIFVILIDAYYASGKVKIFEGKVGKWRNLIISIERKSLKRQNYWNFPSNRLFIEILIKNCTRKISRETRDIRISMKMSRISEIQVDLNVWVSQTASSCPSIPS